MPHTILEIAVPTPLRQTFDYLAPPHAPAGGWQSGQRVRIPFGRRETVGVVLGTRPTSTLPAHQLKRVREALDNEPVLNQELLQLIRRAASYYHHPIGEVIATVLPTLLGKGEPARVRGTQHWQLTEPGHHIETETLSRRAPKQARLLELLRQHPAGLTGKRIAETINTPGAALRALRDKGWVEDQQQPTLLKGRATEVFCRLNTEQQAACEAIRNSLGTFAALLLDGVTGSGKTEVYLHAIEACLARRQQVLLIVPEIGLTPQLIQRLQQRLATTLVAMHSGLSDRERLNAWLAAADGRARVIIGTRSAVFVPLPEPGLFIVDEEHDTSLKQQDGFRYHGRDLLVWRAQQLGLPVVLGSATPSLETLHNARLERYRHLPLQQRAGAAMAPHLALLDVRAQPMDEGLSATLKQTIDRHLAAGGQILLFLNRRGFAPTLICHECGWVAECGRCDVHFTLHQRQAVLRCHHCDSQRPLPAQCPNCGSTDLRPLGSGTERIEQALARHWPDVERIRIDRDSTRNKGELDRRLALAESGAARLLLGTQMLAKGHHFPGVTLVAILDADQGLFSTDFRASERLAQLIVQVAGRAGRAERPGEVIIQTHHPDHPLLLQLVSAGYASFARALLAEREIARLPPYRHMALLRAEASTEQRPMDFLSRARELATPLPDRLQLWGPVPAPMPRRAGRYRAQLSLIAADRPALHHLLTRWIPQLAGLPGARQVRWSLDVDPVDTY